MAIASLPLSDSFALVWSWDPALERGDDEEKFAEDYARCVERLDFSPLIKEGMKPTLFHFRPVPLRELYDAGYGDMEGASLLFRMALVKVENFDGLPPLNKKPSQQYPKLGPLVDRKVVDHLDQLCADLGIGYGHLVSTLGGAVMARLSGVRPK